MLASRLSCPAFSLTLSLLTIASASTTSASAACPSPVNVSMLVPFTVTDFTRRDPEAHLPPVLRLFEGSHQVVGIGFAEGEEAIPENTYHLRMVHTGSGTCCTGATSAASNEGGTVSSIINSGYLNPTNQELIDDDVRGVAVDLPAGFYKLCISQSPIPLSDVEYSLFDVAMISVAASRPMPPPPSQPPPAPSHPPESPPPEPPLSPPSPRPAEPPYPHFFPSQDMTLSRCLLPRDVPPNLNNLSWSEAASMYELAYWTAQRYKRSAEYPCVTVGESLAVAVVATVVLLCSCCCRMAFKSFGDDWSNSASVMFAVQKQGGADVGVGVALGGDCVPGASPSITRKLTNAAWIAAAVGTWVVVWTLMGSNNGVSYQILSRRTHELQAACDKHLTNVVDGSPHADYHFYKFIITKRSCQEMTGKRMTDRSQWPATFSNKEREMNDVFDDIWPRPQKRVLAKAMSFSN